MKSYKTTIAGVCAILAALAGAGTAWANGTSIDIPSLIAAIVAGVGLIAARDNNKSSEAVGAK